MRTTHLLFIAAMGCTSKIETGVTSPSDDATAGGAGGTSNVDGEPDDHDDDDEPGVDTGDLTANRSPSCTIIAPTDGDIGAAEQPHRFEGIVTDEDEPDGGLFVSWFSNHDGPLGNTESDATGLAALTVAALSPNTHELTLTATDASGASCSDTAIYLAAVPPQVSIYMPDGEGAYSTGGESPTWANFAAGISDDFDAPNELALVWSTDTIGPFSLEPTVSDEPITHEGVLYKGRTFVTVDLAIFGPGEHILTLTATDSHGLSESDSAIICVDGCSSR